MAAVEGIRPKLYDAHQQPEDFTDFLGLLLKTHSNLGDYNKGTYEAGKPRGGVLAVKNSLTLVLDAPTGQPYELVPLGDNEIYCYWLREEPRLQLTTSKRITREHPLLVSSVEAKITGHGDIPLNFLGAEPVDDGRHAYLLPDVATFFDRHQIWAAPVKA